MWCLKSNEGLCIYILPNQKKSFGKSQSDIKLVRDAAISELHAVISVESNSVEPGTQYNCVISNVSKNGTVVARDKEKKKLSGNDKFTLRPGDVVQFGQKYTFVVMCHLFVIVKSGLNEEDTERLRNIVDYLGGSLSETWDNSCTHLTVAKSVLFTTKLACALASAKSIVTIMYWEAVNIAIKEAKELPKIEDFLPSVKEDWLKVCPRFFLPNKERKTLFKGLSFVHFCTKQYFTYAQLIAAAGGKSCVYPTKRPLTPRDLTAKNAIVIQQPANDSSQLTQVFAVDYPIIYNKLRAIKRRLVSDTEIPLAILHCTKEMYCNPKFDFATFVKLKTQMFSPSDLIIADDTQDIVDNPAKRQIERDIIPETCDSPSNNVVAKKSEERDTYNAKKSDIAIRDEQNNRESKRKIIPETCDSQISSHISKKSRLSDENEQSNTTISTDDTAMKIQTGESNLKNINCFDESQNNISNNNKNNFASDIVCKKIIKQAQIIPESCCSSEESVNNSFSEDKSNNKQACIIFDALKSKEENIVSNLVVDKEKNIKLQEKENNSILGRNNKRKNMSEENKYKLQQFENTFMNKDNSLTSENNCKENLSVENDNLNDNHDKSENTRLEESKNLERPRIVSIEKIDNNEMYIHRQKEKSTSGKYCFTVEESQNSLKDSKLDSAGKSERNREDQNVKENKIQQKDKRKEKPQKPVANWYERYVNKEFTDEILRKDTPCGKRFRKKSIMIPKKILKADDFVL
ncbi:uncharacterized protein LOC114937737 [Nylanderia fulva]|uniref:uncharacterized protein LOC114937737 n=1 Tax=Nylanderia fulva TaxID=613905 RepID=UPI0010FADD2B|nr:uncharacterized protein LOC114937737 [Nylanderia fulva]